MRFIASAVLARRDDQIHALQLAIVVNLIVMKQDSSRRLADADALEPVYPGMGPQTLGKDFGILDGLRDSFHSGQDLD